MQGVVILVTSRSREKKFFIAYDRSVDGEREKRRERKNEKIVGKKKEKIFIQEGNMLASIKKYADSARTAKK